MVTVGFQKGVSSGRQHKDIEVLCSHYLELNSDKALVETDIVIAKEFELV